MHLSIPFPLLPVKSNYRKKSLLWISILCSIAAMFFSVFLRQPRSPDKERKRRVPWLMLWASHAILQLWSWDLCHPVSPAAILFLTGRQDVNGSIPEKKKTVFRFTFFFHQRRSWLMLYSTDSAGCCQSTVHWRVGVLTLLSPWYVCE